MNRGLALAGYAVSEASMLLAAGMIIATGLIATGRGIEWVLVYWHCRAEDRRERIT